MIKVKIEICDTYVWKTSELLWKHAEKKKNVKLEILANIVAFIRSWAHSVYNVHKSHCTGWKLLLSRLSSPHVFLAMIKSFFSSMSQNFYSYFNLLLFLFNLDHNRSYGLIFERMMFNLDTYNSSYINNITVYIIFYTLPVLNCIVWCGWSLLPDALRPFWYLLCSPEFRYY